MLALLALAGPLAAEAPAQARGRWNPGVQYGAASYGAGNLAAGRGSRNLQNSEARSINKQTNMQMNEYMYQSLRQNNANIVKQHEEEYKDYNDAYAKAQDRLRNSPTPADIYSGDALNVAVTELVDPKYADKIAELSQQIPVNGLDIANCNFRTAVEVASLALSDLTNSDPPKVFGGQDVAREVAAYKAAAARVNQEVEQKGRVSKPAIDALRASLKTMYDRVDAMQDADPNDRTKALARLKAGMALCYMFSDASGLEVYLAQAGEAKEADLNQLLGFMQSYNLTFGPASTPPQRSSYKTLYQALAKLRKQAFGDGTGTLPLDAPRPTAGPAAADNYYSGQSLDDVHPGADATPPPPAPGG
jgi:hypothetical protein